MKKSLIYWIISAVIIVVGAVFLISSGFNANTDLADGTQIEVAFGEVVDSAKFEEIRSELVNKFRAAGYSVDYGTMLKDVNAITGVRFTISEDGITEENVVSVIGSSYEVEVNAVNFYGETPTGAFIMQLLSFSLQVTFSFAARVQELLLCLHSLSSLSLIWLWLSLSVSL